MTLSPVANVWNRAAMENGGSAPLEGDRALASLLLVQGMVMNGGVAHVFEALTQEEIDRGVDGFLYFGFSEVAALLNKAGELTDEEREALDSDYSLLLPSDATLGRAIESMLRDRPGSFAPLVSP